MSPVHKELREAQTRLVGRLRSEYGIVAHRVNLRGFYHSFRMWNSKMDNEEVREREREYQDSTTISEIRCFLPQFQEQRLVIKELVPEGSAPPNLPLEIVKSFVGRSVYTFPILLVALLEKVSRGVDPLSEVFVRKTAGMISLVKPFALSALVSAS